MPIPAPGTILAEGAVYRTVDLSTILPVAVVDQIPAQYADLDFSYGLSSKSGTPVTIAGTIERPVVDYVDANGLSVGLRVADLSAEGGNGFRFTDPTGRLWTVLDRPVAGETSADFALDQAISLEAANPLLQIELERIKTQIDQATGGHPLVFPTNPLDSAPCFARGTRIATSRGEVAVEDLAVGDLATLANGDQAPITWVGRRRVHLARHPAPASVAPVRIEAGALGAGLPARTLRVSPDHALFLDGVLVPAGLLVDGDTIAQDFAALVDYVHVELARHAILLAEGAPAESYLDTGNRAMFSNARIVALNPEMAPGDGVAASTPCAPMILHGARLDAIRASLPGRAALGVAC